MSGRFAPRWYFVLLTLAAVVLFVSLGLWQWRRGDYRSEQWQLFARDAPLVEVTSNDLARMPRFARVLVQGEFDADRQFLLDNISHAGAPGYEVLTVLRVQGGGQLLVNRGWLPYTGYRDRLPEVTLADVGLQQITGRLSVLPVAGMESGRLAPSLEGSWPRLTSFPTHEQLELAYGGSLLAPVLLLDATSGTGYLRDWQPPGIPPERNYSYAVQWWSFAVLALVLFAGLNLKMKR